MLSPFLGFSHCQFCNLSRRFKILELLVLGLHCIYNICWHMARTEAGIGHLSPTTWQRQEEHFPLVARWRWGIWGWQDGLPFSVRGYCTGEQAVCFWRYYFSAIIVKAKEKGDIIIKVWLIALPFHIITSKWKRDREERYWTVQPSAQWVSYGGRGRREKDSWLRRPLWILIWIPSL